MAEMQHHQVRLYPFDAEENDDEELQLNERIRVSSSLRVQSFSFKLILYRTCCHSRSSGPSETSWWTANPFEGAKTAGE